MNRANAAAIVFITVLAGCAGPAPQTTTANAKPPPGPGCSACIVENPGDVRPCVKICHRPESDLGGADAGGVIR